MTRRLAPLLVLLLLAGSYGPAPAIAARSHERPQAPLASFGTALEGSARTGHGPAATAYDPGSDTVYVANGFSPNKNPNPGGNTVSVIDARRCDARSVSGCRGRWPTVTVGNEPSAVAVDTEHRTLYVSSITDSTVSVIDTRHCQGHDSTGCASARTAIVPIGAGSFGMYVDRETNTVYVANFYDGSVSMIDTGSCNGLHPSGCPTTTATAFSVSGGAGDVDVNHRTHTGYVAHLSGFDAFDTRTCNASTQTGCGDLGHFTICDGCTGPWSARVDESTNTVYEGNGDQLVAAVDGRSCNAGDLAGCATAQYGTVDLRGPGYAHVLYLAVDEPLHSVYILSHKDDHVFVIDTTLCNGSHPAGCASLVPDAIHTATNPQNLALDGSTHTLYVADQNDDELSVIDAARCSALDRSGCRRLPPRVAVDSPNGVAVSEQAHTAYVASDSRGVTMIDLRSCHLGHLSGCAGPHPTVAAGDRPLAITVDEPSHTAYVANGGGSVSILDTRTCNAHPSGCAVVATLAVPQGVPADVAVNPTTRTLYVAASQAGEADAVVVFDASTCNASTTSGCGQQGGLLPIGPVSACDDPPRAFSRLALAVDRPTDTVYAAQIPCDESVNADSVLVYDVRHCQGGDLSGCRGPVARVHAGEDPFGLDVDEATRTLYAPLLGNGEQNGAVAVIDVRSCNATVTSGCGQVTAVAPSGFGSVGVAIDARSHDVYVTNDEDASVSVIDGTTCRAGRPSGCAVTPRLLPTDDYPSASIALAGSVRTAYVTSKAKGTVSLLPMSRGW